VHNHNEVSTTKGTKMRWKEKKRRLTASANPPAIDLFEGVDEPALPLALLPFAELRLTPLSRGAGGAGGRPARLPPAGRLAGGGGGVGRALVAPVLASLRAATLPAITGGIGRAAAKAVAGGTCEGCRCWATCDAAACAGGAGGGGGGTAAGATTSSR
jgi:hypothetical protein